MLEIYNQDEFPKEGPALFLAGPTPRENRVPSWRPEAVGLLKELGFDGGVIIPEDRGFQNNNTDFDYSGQIEWEHRGLDRADIVVFWVPRELKDMPAFTTNIEFGIISTREQKYVLGFPKEAPKMRYLEWIAKSQGQTVYHSLRDTLKAAIDQL